MNAAQINRNDFIVEKMINIKEDNVQKNRLETVDDTPYDEIQGIIDRLGERVKISAGNE